jgi:hypothetical protein
VEVNPLLYTFNDHTYDVSVRQPAYTSKTRDRAIAEAISLTPKIIGLDSIPFRRYEHTARELETLDPDVLIPGRESLPLDGELL